jgi:lipopolysaccharide export system protein LptA
LDRALTSGAAKITIFPAQTAGPASAAPSGLDSLPAQRTVVTAGKFDAKFGRTPQGRSSLQTIHGAPNAKIVNVSPGQPDRVSTSRTLDTAFLPQGGIDSILQRGNFSYTDNLTPDKRTEAWADHARYTPVDQIISLAGSPRVVDGSTATTSRIIRINRSTGEVHADDDVKSTYSEVKEQPDGALLASSSPIHVTSRSMVAHKNSGLAFYTGNARLWQDANIIEAPSIQFDREHRSVVAEGTAIQRVSTLLIQQDKSQPKGNQQESAKVRGSDAPKPEKFTPVAITSSRMTYVDADRKARYEGSVLAKGLDFTGSADAMDVYLLPRSQTSANQSLNGPGQLDHIVGQGNVVVHEAARRADGQQLVYTAADDRFVLTGGPPSIFDAERGRTTGLSLTFFRRDDRVLVEGKESSPVVTRTRVAR